jgi:hypothetical protein
VHNGAKTSLAFDNDVRYTHLAAKSREEDNEFNWVNVVCNDNKRRFLGFDEGNTMIQTILDEERFLGVLHRKYKLEPSNKKNSD